MDWEPSNRSQTRGAALWGDDAASHFLRSRSSPWHASLSSPQPRPFDFGAPIVRSGFVCPREAGLGHAVIGAQILPNQSKCGRCMGLVTTICQADWITPSRCRRGAILVFRVYSLGPADNEGPGLPGPPPWRQTAAKTLLDELTCLPGGPNV